MLKWDWKVYFIYYLKIHCSKLISWVKTDHWMKTEFNPKKINATWIFILSLLATRDCSFPPPPHAHHHFFISLLHPQIIDITFTALSTLHSVEQWKNKRKKKSYDKIPLICLPTNNWTLCTNIESESKLQNHKLSSLQL